MREIVTIYYREWEREFDNKTEREGRERVSVISSWYKLLPSINPWDESHTHSQSHSLSLAHKTLADRKNVCKNNYSQELKQSHIEERRKKTKISREP